MTLEQEKALLDNIHADPRHFGALFDHYYKKIFGYAYRRVLDYDIAKDITAETFLKAFLNIRTFTWKGISISSWLYKIATNDINSYFRKKKYSPEKLQSILDYELLSKNGQMLEDEKEELEAELKAHSDFIQIQQHLKTLDTKYQEVIALRYFESKDILEISSILEKPEGTIKSLLSRGLEKLRKKIYK
jgi:RNA polymerase sigma-70 factor, ECF subfamily